METLKLVIYGGCLIGAIIVLLSFLFKKKKKKFTFDEWYDHLERVFLKNSFSSGYVQQLCKRKWFDSYADGLSPEEAFRKYFKD